MEPKHGLIESPEERLRREIEWYNQTIIDRNGRTHDSRGRFAMEDVETWEPEKSLLEKLEEYGLLSTDFKRERFGTYKRTMRLGILAWEIIIVLGVAYVVHVIFK